MILPNDKDLTLRNPLHIVDSPACLHRDTSTDVMTFVFINILCHHICIVVPCGFSFQSFLSFFEYSFPSLSLSPPLFLLLEHTKCIEGIVRYDFYRWTSLLTAKCTVCCRNECFFVVCLPWSLFVVFSLHDCKMYHIMNKCFMKLDEIKLYYNRIRERRKSKT